MPRCHCRYDAKSARRAVTVAGGLLDRLETVACDRLTELPSFESGARVGAGRAVGFMAADLLAREVDTSRRRAASDQIQCSPRWFMPASRRLKRRKEAAGRLHARLNDLFQHGGRRRLVRLPWRKLHRPAAYLAVHESAKKVTPPRPTEEVPWRLRGSGCETVGSRRIQTISAIRNESWITVVAAEYGVIMAKSMPGPDAGELCRGSRCRQFSSKAWAVAPVGERPAVTG